MIPNPLCLPVQEAAGLACARITEARKRVLVARLDQDTAAIQAAERELKLALRAQLVISRAQRAHDGLVTLDQQLVDAIRDSRTAPLARLA